MRNLDKYKGVIPAFYACYDEKGEISPERVRALTEYFVDKKVRGVYVNGSSGECIYQIFISLEYHSLNSFSINKIILKVLSKLSMLYFL